MKNYSYSPVPNNQIPHLEFLELKNNSFFSLPSKNIFYLYRYLFITWLISYPLFVLISTGSYSLHNNIYKILIFSLFTSLIIPLILLFRQYLSWTYISNRLSAEFIYYEESDWHDCQTWKKPSLWYRNDKYIVQEEVQPIILRIKNTTYSLLLILIISPLLVFNLPI